MDSKSEEKQFCSECQKINIENISKVGGLPIHSNIHEIEACAECCPICRVAIVGLLQEISAETEVSITCDDQSYDWRTSSNWHRYQMRATWVKEQNEGYLALELFGGNFQWDGERGAPAYRVGILSVGGFDLRVWADDPAAAFGVPHARRLPESSGSEESLNTARTWLNDCMRLHSVCRATTAGEDELTTQRPTRLIKLDGSGKLKLVDGAIERGPYIALSYQWGTERAVWRTVRDNLAQKQQAFHDTELPKTLQHAIQYSSRLNIHHIWIDSICIIQDDPEDWLREAAKMGQVYSQATLTLAADCSPSSTAGLYNSQSYSHLDETPPSLILKTTLADGRPSHLHLSESPLSPQWPRLVDRSPLTLRGWCCQERLLSRRILHFAASQLFWECPHCIRSEDGFESSELPVRSKGVRDWRAGYRPQPHGPSEYRPAEKFGFFAMNKLTQSLLRLWYVEIVASSYSRAKLTVAEDKLIAVAGLARFVHGVKPTRYLAGMWEEGLIFGLCWMRNGEGLKAGGYRAPSWSWASQDSGVGFRWLGNPADVSESYFAKVVGVGVDCEGGDQFSLVRGGSVRIWAKAVDGRLCVGAKAGGMDRLVLSNGIECKAYMDSPTSRDEGGIVALLIMGPPMHLVFLLLRTSTPSTNSVRVGLADVRLTSRDMIRRFDQVQHQTFTII